MEINEQVREHGHDIPAYSPRDNPKLHVMSTQEMTESPLRTTIPSGITPVGHVASSSDGEKLGEDEVIKQCQSSYTTIVELISTNATSSAFPESFGLSISTTGEWIAAYSSSALYVLSVQHLPDFTDTCRAFRIRRKPLAVALTDVGRFAVLTTSHKIDVYQCGEEQGDLLTGTCKKLETIYLDNEARALAFSLCGEVVAAGSDSGVELKNLSPGSLETDKRQINCASVDHLAFSKDGRSLLATSSAKKSRVSTFISVNEVFEDVFLEENPEPQPLGKIWITQLLFPERLNARQATLLPESTDNMINEVLAFDSQSDRYRIFDVTMKRFTNRQLGLPDGVQWSRSVRLEDALPAIPCDASSAAIAVRLKTDKEIWVYSIPSAWREEPEASTPDSDDVGEDDGGLVPAQRIQLPPKEEDAPPENITSLRWLGSKSNALRRLVALVSTVNVTMPEDVVPTAAPAASGKVLLFDFARNSHPSDDHDSETIMLDLDEISVLEGLADEVLELDREVDIVRRRTQVQRRRPDLSTLPSPRDSRGPRRSLSSGSTSGVAPTLRDVSDSNSNRSAPRRRSFSSMSSMGEEAEIGPIDEPYSQTQPRSQFSLHRAATIAANSPANRMHLLALPSRPLEYRRADGLREMPHESDADNWVPPPPPYSAEPDNAVSLPISANSQVAAAYLPRVPGQARPNTGQPMQQIAPMPPGPQSVPRPTVITPATASTRPSTTSGHVPSPSVPNAFLPTRNTRTVTPIVTRRPVRTSAVPPSSSIAPPMPGHLHSHMTFPPVRHSPRSSVADLDIPIPPIPSGMQSQSMPSSPIAPLDSPRRGSPVAGAPTADLLSSLHRRSGSGDSAPRAARGAHTPNNPRRISSVELMRPLPPIPPGQQNVVRGSNEMSRSTRNSPSSRRNQRPVLNRLATIASVASHQRLDGQVPDQIIQSTQTTPETPTTRRQWWRVGNSRDTPQRPGSVAMQIPPRPPPSVFTTSAPPKKEGSLRCILM